MAPDMTNSASSMLMERSPLEKICLEMAHLTRRRGIGTCKHVFELVAERALCIT